MSTKSILDPGTYGDIVRRQKIAYAERIGKILGDFVVDDIKYDWEKHYQVWTCKCKKCGKIKVVNAGNEWANRGGSKCQDCLKKEREAALIAKRIEADKKKREKELERIEYLNSFIGTKIENRTVTGVSGKKLIIKCDECGKEIFALPSGLCNIKKCKDAVYNCERHIGTKFGHLSVIERVENKLKCLCDCGCELLVEPKDIVSGSRVDCGSVKCKYVKERYISAATINREKGIDFEIRYKEYLESLGYSVERTGESNDFGVDLIVTHNNEKTAVQLKYNSGKTGVKAVQEVFSGGHYYGCDRFTVITRKMEYTDNAVDMAKKLGVRLMCLENIDFKDGAKIGRKNYWTINGVTKSEMEWCENNTSIQQKFSRQITTFGENPETALKIAKGEIKKRHSKKESFESKCNKYGLSSSLVNYRMKYKGETFEEAVSYPPRQQAKPYSKMVCTTKRKKKEVVKPSDYGQMQMMCM